MSYNATDWAFKQPIEDSGAKLVLLAICHHADAKGEAFPSYARIREITGLAKRTVSRKVSMLVDMGLLQVEERTRPNGSRTSTLYRIDIKKQVEGVTQSQQGVDTESAGGGQRVSTLTRNFNKPSNNSSIIRAEPDETEEKIDWTDLASSVM
jgi:pyocin large subunit-like protein